MSVRVAVLFAHPYPRRSRANKALLRALEGVDGVEVRSLYERYPDFDVDVEAEQALVREAPVVVWQHPMYWYSVPGLLKHWFDKVLTRGFAYGPDGTALRGKRCLWVTTTGGDDDAFQPGGLHDHPLAAFVPPLEQTARFCGMRWEPPIVVHGAHKLDDEALGAHAGRYRERLLALTKELA
jgi:glutathione-regulated potassium-efflux system ancillary protein KefF